MSSVTPETASRKAPPLWRHQEEALEFLGRRRAAMMAMAMGTGKSRVIVEHCRRIRASRTLVLCPKSVLQVWPREFRKYADGEFSILVLEGGTCADKAGRLAGALANQSGPIVVVVNYESAFRAPLSGALARAGFGLGVLDESHRIKAPGGSQSKFCHRLFRAIPGRVALTGTPMPHSPLDVYAQFRAIDQSVFGGSFTAFKARYAVMGGFEGREVKDFQNLDELQSKMRSACFQVDSSVLQLEEPVHVERFCEIGGRARKLYEALERELVGEIEEGTVTAANALTRLLRLRQITGGHTRTEDGRTVEVDSAKAELFADLLTDLHEREPIVVCGVFRHDLDSILKVGRALGRRCGQLSGAANDLAEWQAGNLDLLAVQEQSGGVGVDLTRAAYSVQWSVGFSLGDYEQWLARTQRPGQTRRVTYIHLLAEGTVDHAVYGALRKRADVVGEVLRGLGQRAEVAA